MIRANENEVLGRHLLVIELLGHELLTKTVPQGPVDSGLERILKVFERRAKDNDSFGVKRWRDTFVLYQLPDGFQACMFRDIQAAAIDIFLELSALGFAVRGTIAFWEFEVAPIVAKLGSLTGVPYNQARRANNAYKALGVSVLPSAWKELESEKPGTVERQSYLSA